MTATNAELELGLGTLLNEVQNRRIRLKGTIDPTAGAGLAAPTGVEYDQYNVGYTTLLKTWRKTTAPNTGWIDAGGGGGGGSNPMVPLGSWNMTNPTVAAAPSGSHNLEAAATETDADNFEMTPGGTVSEVKMVGSAAIALPGATAHWARHAVPATGGDLAITGIVVANAGATPADVAASITGAPTGTCTHFAGVFADLVGELGPAGGINLFLGDPGQTDNTATSLTVTPGSTQLRFGLSVTAGSGTLYADNGGTPEAGATLWNLSALSGGLRVYVLMYFASGTPAFPSGTMNFDLGDSTGGRLPFATMADPTPPVGAVDNSRWLVSAPGSFGGRSALTDDIVEFHSGLTKIQVYPADPVTDAEVVAGIVAYLTANPPTPLVVEARAKARLRDIANDPTTYTFTEPLTRADCMIIGSAPAGAFSAFTAGNIAIFDGATWQEFAAADISGICLGYVDYTGAIFPYGFVFSPDYVISAPEPAFTIGSAGESAASLSALDWYPQLQPASPHFSMDEHTFTGAGPHAVTVGNAQCIYINVNATCTINASIGGLGFVGVYGWVATFNSSAAPVVVTLYGEDLYIGAGRTVLTLIGPGGHMVNEASKAIQPLNIVRSLYDLPAAVAGLITLPANSNWLIAGDVDIGSNWIEGGAGVSLVGLGTGKAIIRGSAAGYTVRPVARMFMRDLQVTNTGSTCLASADSSLLTAVDCLFTKAAKVAGGSAGTRASAEFVRCRFDDGVQGLLLESFVGHVEVDDCNFSQAGSGNGKIQLGTTANGLDVSEYVVVRESRIRKESGFPGIYKQGTLTADGESIRFYRNYFYGAGSALSAITVDDNEFVFEKNDGCPDSRVIGRTGIPYNNTATGVATASTYYAAQFSGALGGTLRRFTNPSNGKLKYTGKATRTFKIAMTAVLECVTGGTQNMEIRPFVNGGAVSGLIGQVITATSGEKGSVYVEGEVQLSENDEVEAYVANNTGANDIYVRQLLLCIEPVQ